MVYDPVKSYQITESIRKGKKEAKERKELEKEADRSGVSYTNAAVYQGPGHETYSIETTVSPINKKTGTRTTTTTKKNISDSNNTVQPPNTENLQKEKSPELLEEQKAKEVKISSIEEINRQTRINRKESNQETESNKRQVLPEKMINKPGIADQKEINRSSFFFATEEEKAAAKKYNISQNEDVLLPISNKIIQEYQTKTSPETTPYVFGSINKENYVSAKEKQKQFFNERASESAVLVGSSVVGGYGAGLVLSALPEAYSIVAGGYALFETGKSARTIYEISKTNPRYASFEAQKLFFGSVGGLYGADLGSKQFFKFTGGRTGKDYFNQEIRPNIDINIKPKLREATIRVLETDKEILSALGKPVKEFFTIPGGKKARIGGSSARVRSGRISKGELRKGFEYRQFKQGKENIAQNLKNQGFSDIKIKQSLGSYEGESAARNRISGRSKGTRERLTSDFIQTESGKRFAENVVKPQTNIKRGQAGQLMRGLKQNNNDFDVISVNSKGASGLKNGLVEVQVTKKFMKTSDIPNVSPMKNNQESILISRNRPESRFKSYSDLKNIPQSESKISFSTTKGFRPGMKERLLNKINSKKNTLVEKNKVSSKKNELALVDLSKTNYVRSTGEQEYFSKNSIISYKQKNEPLSREKSDFLINSGSENKFLLESEISKKSGSKISKKLDSRQGLFSSIGNKNILDISIESKNLQAQNNKQSNKQEQSQIFNIDMDENRRKNPENKIPEKPVPKIPNPIIPRPKPPRKPNPIPPIVIPPEIIPPIPIPPPPKKSKESPGSTLNFSITRKMGRSKTSKSTKIKNVNEYMPSLTSIGLNIRGKYSKAGEESGLGIRPILKNGKRRIYRKY